MVWIISQFKIAKRKLEESQLESITVLW